MGLKRRICKSFPVQLCLILGRSAHLCLLAEGASVDQGHEVMWPAWL